MILVDTSVWIDHLRTSNKKLITLLLNNQVFIHPFVVGELACGNLKNRKEILDLLQKLPSISYTSFEEILIYIEQEKLYGKGLSLIDIHLLASSKLSKAKLWTLDKTLKQQAHHMGIGI